MTSIAAGSRLGPYEVVSRLGAGGMGEVFRARDTRLDRTVAIKVLPEEFASSAQLKIRFEREAKAISQISHPHICALYDVGNADGVEFLVLEYLEGETLAERMARGPLPIADVLRFGSQIASALAWSFVIARPSSASSPSMRSLSTRFFGQPRLTKATDSILLLSRVRDIG